MGRYVVDFVSHAAKLIIEIDGPLHDLPEKQLHDAERTAWLEAQGYRVLRLAESAVRNDLYTVVDRIAAELSPPTLTLPPSQTLRQSNGKGESPCLNF
jgi:very-short-patch-repair endonuclease